MKLNILNDLFENKATYVGEDIIIAGVKFNKADFLAKIEKYKANKETEKKDNELIS